MTDKEHLGKLAKDIPQEKLDELFKKGYSVSPHSGRLRKKIKKSKTKKPFSKNKLNTWLQKIGWVFLLILFLISIIMIVPQLIKNPSEVKKFQKR